MNAIFLGHSNDHSQIMCTTFNINFKSTFIKTNTGALSGDGNMICHNIGKAVYRNKLICSDDIA